MTEEGDCMTKLTWNRDRCGGTVSYTSGWGHRITRVVAPIKGLRPAIWHAFRPGHEIVCLDTNDDGTPYIPRARNRSSDMPQARDFPTASAAKRFLEAEQ